MCLENSISIGDIFAAITGIALAVFAFLQYRINKRQAEHQHTTTAIDYCKQLMEFFDACEKDWNKIEAETQKEIREAFENAVKEQKDGIPSEVQRKINLHIKNRDFLKVVVEICPFLRLTGTAFQIFLNRVNGYIMHSKSHMIYVLNGIRKINLDLLNYHQVLLIQKRILYSAPSFSFYFDSMLQQIIDIEERDSFMDGWRNNMKSELSVLSNLAGDIDERAYFLTELYSDEYSPAEKEEMKKKFAKKTWDNSAP